MWSIASVIARGAAAPVRALLASGRAAPRPATFHSLNKAAKPVQSDPGRKAGLGELLLAPYRLARDQIRAAFSTARQKMAPEWFDFLVKVIVPVFGIQWVGWALASIFKTEKFYDLFGSATYLYVAVIMGLSRWTSNSVSQNIQALLVSAWAVRLGCFLFYRVMKTGRDTRFNKIKENLLRFLIAWTLQGVWITVTILPSVFMWMGSYSPGKIVRSFGPREGIGFAIWLIGFLIEVIADGQKSVFKANPDNEGKFIQSGLWKISRHPNYFGEILLWTGLWLSATPYFKSPYMFFSVLCPIFDFLLITKISGIPMLEVAGRKKWGDQVAYQEYLLKTPALVPCVPWLDGFCVPKPKVVDEKAPTIGGEEGAVETD